MTTALSSEAAGKPVEVWFTSLPSGLTRGMKRVSGSRGS